MWIKDMETGEVREYGADRHDALMVSDNGRYLTYENLQNGDGSYVGGYRFVTENGYLPGDDPELIRCGAEEYANIGGFDEVVHCCECRNSKPYEGGKFMCHRVRGVLRGDFYCAAGKLKG